MKFIPPDEPTAVYPIGSLKKDDPDDTPAPAAPGSAARNAASPASKATPIRDLGEIAGDGRKAQRATPRPFAARTPPPSARSPLLLVGALAIGMLLAAALVGLLALLLLLLQ